MSLFPLVYIKFPKTGLGNKMLVWARGYVFAHINGMQLITSSWFHLSFGAFIRNENKKRIYAGYFKGASIVKRIFIAIFSKFNKKDVEPEIEKIKSVKHDMYFFYKIYSQFVSSKL